MPQTTTTHVEVLEKLLARLRSQINEFNESTCILAIDPKPLANIDHNFYATVSPLDGSFDERVFEGAGDQALIEDTMAIVTLWSAIKQDRRGHDVQLLTDPSRGLLARKRDVLKALAGYMLVNAAGDNILTNYLEPLTTLRPVPPEPRVGDCQIVFRTQFEWDLS